MSINANCVVAPPPFNPYTTPPLKPNVRFDASNFRFISNVLATYISLALNPLRFNGCEIYHGFFFYIVCLGKDLSIQYIIDESYTLSFCPRKDYNYWIKNSSF